MGKNRMDQNDGASSTGSSFMQDTDELLGRQLQLDLEIEKFLEVETWEATVTTEDDPVVESALGRKAVLPVEEAQLDEETKAIFNQDHRDVKRTLQARDGKIEAMNQRLQAMTNEFTLASQSNTAAMKNTLEAQDKSEMV